MFSPQYHVWNSLCPKQRVIKLASDGEKADTDEGKIWFDAPETIQIDPISHEVRNQESELKRMEPKPSKAARTNQASFQTLDIRPSHIKRLRRVANCENLRLEKSHR